MYGDPYAINDDGNEDDDQDGIPNYADAHHPFNLELIDMEILFDSDGDGILDLADVILMILPNWAPAQGVLHI